MKTTLSSYFNEDGVCVSKVFMEGKKFYVSCFIPSLDDWELEGPFANQNAAEDHAEDYACE